MPPVGVEPTISAGERPQTYTLDRAASGIGDCYMYVYYTKEEQMLIFSIVAGRSSSVRSVAYFRVPCGN